MRGFNAVATTFFFLGSEEIGWKEFVHGLGLFVVPKYSKKYKVRKWDF